MSAAAGFSMSGSKTAEATTAPSPRPAAKSGDDEDAADEEEDLFEMDEDQVTPRSPLDTALGGFFTHDMAWRYEVLSAMTYSSVCLIPVHITPLIHPRPSVRFLLGTRERPTRIATW
jgi:hypothetical protein